MVTVNSLQAIYKLLCASPDTSTLGKQLNAQLINVRTGTALLQIANNAQARVPVKPISANPGLNLTNRGIHFAARLDSVPESMINLNLGIN